MTECPACLRAEEFPRTDIYTNGCVPCEARALAGSPEARARARDPAALTAAMRRTWPRDDDHRRGRPLVWVWIQIFEETLR